jgi:hypothetical protein
MRRDKNDERWQEVKRKVKERDQGQDRFLKCLTLKEFEAFKALNPDYLKILDPAHVLDVGDYPSLMYCADNILTINRTAHERLDSNRSPISGNVIEKGYVKQWWVKILGPEQFQNLMKFKDAKAYFC